MFGLGIGLGLVLGLGGPVIAQTSPGASAGVERFGEAGSAPPRIEATVRSEDVGIGGVVRAGDWTPLRLQITNRTAEPRRLRCEWLVSDRDGDLVRFQRTATVSSNRESSIWLYAAPAQGQTPDANWPVRIIDDQTGRLLDVVRAGPSGRMIDPTTGVVGVLGTASMGLQHYREPHTQHEAIRRAPGLSVERLPDRWYGYETLMGLIWTPTGGDPSDPDFSPEAAAALREWVRRGGHLVVVLPAIGGTWADSSLADLLPPVQTRTRSDVRPPFWLGAGLPENLRVDMKTFELPDATGSTGSNVASEVGAEGDAEASAARRELSVLLRSVDRDTGEPIVVAHSVGFGRVTLIGIDISDPRLPRQKTPLPNGPVLWNAVFGWRGPAWDRSVVEDKIENNELSRLSLRNRAAQHGFISRLTAMQRAASTVLLAAVFFFIAYWLVAGPLGLLALRKKGWERHSWIAFAGVVLGFAAVAWAGAWLARPREPRIAHVSFLDLQPHRDHARAHAWWTLYWPRHENVNIQLPDGPQTLSSTGHEPDAGGVGYLTTRRYAVDAGEPRTLDAPMRASAKPFEASFLGPVDEPWNTIPSAGLGVDSAGLPIGRLSHNLPGTLQNTLIIYCPGDGQEPLAWRVGDWRQAPEILDLADPQNRQPLPLAAGRADTWRGYLPTLIRLSKPGELFADTEPRNVRPDHAAITSMIEVLTFYNVLPPPNYWKTNLGERTVMYKRPIGREYDLSPLLDFRRLIVVGQLPDAPTPLPLSVNGDRPPSRGWTTVRWIAPLP